MKALIALLLLTILFGCQKGSDQGSPPIAAPAATKVTEQTGRVIINPQFDNALRFADGLAAVRIGDQNRQTGPTATAPHLDSCESAS